MSFPAAKNKTVYDELVDLPENVVGEIILGTLLTSYALFT
jgi:hypothetical protein